MSLDLLMLATTFVGIDGFPVIEYPKSGEDYSLLLIALLSIMLLIKDLDISKSFLDAIVYLGAFVAVIAAGVLFWVYPIQFLILISVVIGAIIGVGIAIVILVSVYEELEERRRRKKEKDGLHLRDFSGE